MIHRNEGMNTTNCPLCDCKVEQMRGGDMNYFSCEACGFAFARPLKPLLPTINPGMDISEFSLIAE